MFHVPGRPRPVEVLEIGVRHDTENRKSALSHFPHKLDAEQCRAGVILQLGIKRVVTTRLGKMIIQHTLDYVLGVCHEDVRSVADVSEVRQSPSSRSKFTGWSPSIMLRRKGREQSWDRSSSGSVATVAEACGPPKGHASHQKSTLQRMLSSGHTANFWLEMLLNAFYAQ
jgi:hypothetical protein